MLASEADLAAPELSRRWQQHLLDHVSAGEVPGSMPAPGIHRVTVRALDPGVTLDRLEIAFTGAPRGYGPVPETRIRALSHP